MHVEQNIVTARYLKKTRLQSLLEKLFPGQTEFNIRVSPPHGLTAPRPLAQPGCNIGMRLADERRSVVLRRAQESGRSKQTQSSRAYLGIGC